MFAFDIYRITKIDVQHFSKNANKCIANVIQLEMLIFESLRDIRFIESQGESEALCHMAHLVTTYV